jgi:hypothetical protein
MTAGSLLYTLTRDVLHAKGTGGMFSGPGIDKRIYIAEDPVRETADRPEAEADLAAWVAEWKVKGKTAIPYGTYRVAWTLSNRFGRSTLQLLGVPGFGGIRIHPGNDADDTEGCLLPGLSRPPAEPYKVVQSRRALPYVEDPICRALERGIPVYIQIRKEIR